MRKRRKRSKLGSLKGQVLIFILTYSLISFSWATKRNARNIPTKQWYTLPFFTGPHIPFQSHHNKIRLLCSCFRLSISIWNHLSLIPIFSLFLGDQNSKWTLKTYSLIGLTLCLWQMANVYFLRPINTIWRLRPFILLLGKFSL